MSGSTVRSAMSRHVKAALTAAVCIPVLLGVFVVRAEATEPAPSWSIEAVAPTYFVPGRGVTYKVVATNAGTATATANKITDKLPPEMEFRSVAFYWSGFEKPPINFAGFCSHTGQEVSCSFPVVQPGQRLMMVVDASLPSNVEEGPVIDEAAVSGGGTEASTSAQSAISLYPAFGVKFSMHTTEVQRAPSASEPSQPLVNKLVTVTQAGAHPAALTTTLQFASQENNNLTDGVYPMVPARDPKDTAVDLPPGLMGDPQAVPRCSLAKVLAGNHKCPADTQVGVAKVVFFDQHESIAPIVDLTPEAGQSAVFGVETSFKVTFLLTAHVGRVQPRPDKREKEEYSVTVTSTGIPISEVIETELTFWGVPADPQNDPLRGLVCRKPTPLFESTRECEGGNEVSDAKEVLPFLTLPTDCAAGSETATVRADSWEEPGNVSPEGYKGYVEAHAGLPGATGCNAPVPFDPSIEMQPDTLPESPLADEPVGLGINVALPQSEEPGSPGTPQDRDAVVTLPEGMSVSPGSVDGLQACDESGPNGINFTGPESEEVVNGELRLAPGHCPKASTIGEAEVETPLLPEREAVKGHLYLARPLCGGAGQSPCTEADLLDGRLYRLYLELGGPGELGNQGVNVKLEGKTEANPVTGQLTTTFSGNPQFPFSKLRIHLNGGPRAPLATPPTCGHATTTADFTPSSAPGLTPEGVFMPGLPDAMSSSYFEVTGCTSSPPGLNPGFIAGSVMRRAGSFSPFTLTLTRKDREQDFSRIQLHPPLGLLGMLSTVPLCGEPQAAQGTCPAYSQIGSTMVASGAGSHPFEIGGAVYLTTGYKGAPFGLSIVTHVVAGPFNLGVVVVRARIDVDPNTSALTVTSDPLPQIVFGVPLRLQRITVNVDRPGFMFNPTSCKTQQVAATISGAQNAVANVSMPFTAAGCGQLAFKPTFKVSTNRHTSRKRGASLDVKLTFPANAVGRQANVARVKVTLPKQLPSRITTLKKACRAATFAANPASCPSGSLVGIARASTPVLPVPLSGPVYFVSHGGEAFPSLVVVLEGDGVRVDLTGATFINKKGITSSTFKTVPDVPVRSFELFLPQGPNSALSAPGGNLCKTHGLVMPTTFTAQNGAQFKQRMKIAVPGCTKAKENTARGTAKGRKSSSGPSERAAMSGKVGG